MSISTLHLPTNFQLSVTADAQSSGTVFRINSGSSDTDATSIAASTTTTIGPFNTPRDFRVISVGQALTTSIAASGFIEGVTATASELNIMDGVTATTTELNLIDGYTGTTAELNTVDGQTVTAAEVNNSSDVSARVEELTATATGTVGIQSLELNHISVVIAATLADSTNHEGMFIVKNTSASGTEAHTLTLTAGTFDGTNTIATMNAPDESLMVYFDSAGDGTIIENVGGVVLS